MKTLETRQNEDKKEEKMKNYLTNYFGSMLIIGGVNKNTNINKVYIFKDNKVKVIANYFLDNFNKEDFIINGDITRKNKVDLTSKNNFYIKSNEENYLFGSSYDLYINGDLNNYVFNKIELNGEQLNLCYNINNLSCYQCIGWNHKESNEIRYNKYQEVYEKIHYISDGEDFMENIQKLNDIVKEYKQVKEVEKNYTALDYKKMSLASGTSEEENKTMLLNNGFDI